MVSKNGPKWLTCKPLFKPSFVTSVVAPGIPALLTKISNFFSELVISSLNFLIDSKEDRSRCLKIMLVLFESFFILDIDSVPSVISATMTLHPLVARPKAVSNPIPRMINAHNNYLEKNSTSLVNYLVGNNNILKM